MFVSRHMSLLSLHTTAIKSPLVLTRMSPRFNHSVLGLRSLGMPFLCNLTVPQQKICFLGQVVIQVRGGKKVVHIQFMAKSFYSPCQISHCCVCCCQVLCRSLSVFTEVNTHVSCWPKNLGLQAVILKTVAKVDVAPVRLLCCQRRNFSPRRCLNPLRFLVFDSETGESVSHAKFHFPLRNTNYYWQDSKI